MSNKDDSAESKTDPSNQDWGNFIANVTDELDVMSQQLSVVCSQNRNSRRTRSPRTPRGTTFRSDQSGTPLTVNRKLVEELERRRAESPNATIRVRPPRDTERELQTNYQYFPSRKNKTARRIFKPDKLKYETYKSNKRIVPVLTGSPIRASQEE